MINLKGSDFSMGLLDFIFKKNKNSVLVSGDSSTPMHNYFNVGDNVLANNETIFAAVSLLSNAVASAPITLRQNYEQINAEDDNIAFLLEFGLCPYMTTFEFIRCMETERNVKGSSFAIKQYNDSGQIEALLPLHSDFVEPYLDNTTGDLYYKIRDIDGVEYKVHSSLIIEVDYISSDGVKKGISPIDVLRNTINYNNNVSNASLEQINRGLKPNIVITVDQPLTKEMFEKYEEMLQKFEKSGILFIDSQKKISDLKESSVIDTKTFEANEITIKKVASVYNIPISKLWASGQTAKSAEEDDLLYLKDTILPIIRMYEQAFTKGLLSVQDRLQGKRIKFNMNGFARGNMASRGEFYQKMFRNGFYSRNDVRALEDLPPTEGGEEFYISRDLINVKLLDELTLKEMKGSDEIE